MERMLIKTVFGMSCLALLGIVAVTTAQARDIDYNNSEVVVSVAPGEPTEIQFPGNVAGGYKRKASAISIERKDDSLVVFATEALSANGESMIVRLEDGRSYSVRVLKAGGDTPRDAVVKIKDDRGSLVASSSEEEPPYREKNFEYAPPSQVSGLMRDMILVAELGKKQINGYRVSDAHRGETVLNDGTMLATIDQIFIGPNLWGYVLDTQNLLDSSQLINPATFRLDGTRAVSARNWELAAKPLDIEQQLAAKDKTKVYIITRARPTE